MTFITCLGIPTQGSSAQSSETQEARFRLYGPTLYLLEKEEDLGQKCMMMSQLNSQSIALGQLLSICAASPCVRLLLGQLSLIQFLYCCVCLVMIHVAIDCVLINPSEQIDDYISRCVCMSVSVSLLPCNLQYLIIPLRWYMFGYTSQRTFLHLNNSKDVQKKFVWIDHQFNTFEVFICDPLCENRTYVAK